MPSLIGARIANYTRREGSWIAAAAIDKKVRDATWKDRIVRMRGLPVAKLLEWDIVLDCTINGEAMVIWGPVAFSATTLWAWQFEPVTMLYTTAINMVSLVDDEGYVVKTRPFPSDWNFMLAGDELRHYEVLRCRAWTLPLEQWPDPVKLCDGTITKPNEKAIRYVV